MEVRVRGEMKYKKTYLKERENKCLIYISILVEPKYLMENTSRKIRYEKQIKNERKTKEK